MIIISNTSPICYLYLINCLDLFPELFGQVILPKSVRDELKAEGAPVGLQDWIAQPPSWANIHTGVLTRSEANPALDRLHAGERDAILLARHLGADLIILDEKAARQVAKEQSLKVTGLLGLLSEAARLGLLNFPEAIERLQKTNFRASPRLLKLLLDRHEEWEEDLKTRRRSP